MVTAEPETMSVVWDFLAGLRQRFDRYAEVVPLEPLAAVADSTDSSTCNFAVSDSTDDDWRLAFLEDVTDVLVLLGLHENQMTRLASRVARLEGRAL